MQTENQMRRMIRSTACRSLLALLVFVLVPSSVPTSARALENPERELNTDIGIKTQLGAIADFKLPFRSATGDAVTLEQLTLGARPLVIVPVYYDCPRMCGLIHKGVVSLLNKMDLELGKDFFLASISIDPTEQPELAKKRSLPLIADLNELNRPRAEKGWAFLTGPETSVTPLMDQIGFKFRRDGEEFAHGAAIMILTPDGKISQYFTGVEFSAWDVRLALIEASMGGIGSTIDHFLLYCFRFDPTQGKYTWAIYNIVRLLGVLTLLFLGTVIYKATRKNPAAQGN